eukprot:TRINITY_DN419_c0_g1_i2.p1 TRINITY_DN419_c0_g1~~TRINITY_DN419_c0_g1_i2.p1  ORF type:complete len:132 (+),score=36.71 TRINITY_DN419_c0_g1_i2:385-780(+)
MFDEVENNDIINRLSDSGFIVTKLPSIKCYNCYFPNKNFLSFYFARLKVYPKLKQFIALKEHKNAKYLNKLSFELYFKDKISILYPYDDHCFDHLKQVAWDYRNDQLQNIINTTMDLETIIADEIIADEIN